MDGSELDLTSYASTNHARRGAVRRGDFASAVSSYLPPSIGPQRRKNLMHTQRTGKRLTSEGAGRSWTPRSPGARGEHHLSVARTRPASRSRSQGGSASRKP